MAELYRGVIKWFNDAKGFGFIEHENGKDVFVHYSVIEQEGFKTLKDGEEVEYELKEGEKGLHATKVVRVNAPKVVQIIQAIDGDATSLEATALEGGTQMAIEKIRDQKEEQNEDGISFPLDGSASSSLSVSSEEAK